MSWRNWSEQGFGFKLFNGKNDRQVMNFIRKNIPQEITDEEAEALVTTEISYWEIYNDEPSCLVAGIINEKEGTTVFCGYRECRDTDQEEYIGVYPSYPWQLNDADRNMTLDMATLILKKYANILDITDAPNYLEAYYCG